MTAASSPRSDKSDIPASLDPDVLLGVLAHELRTPITTIYAGSAVLAREESLLPAMRRELAADVYAEAARLFRTVEDLLVLTRLEHGALTMSREPVSLVRAAESSAQYEGVRWPELRWTVRPVGTPAPVVADTNALAHALRNLIANIAWRANGRADLEITVRSSDDDVACCLRDTTGTLEDGDLDILFGLPDIEPRVGTTSPGIALYITDQLIRAMQGETWAQRADDGAVEIGFSLPRYEPN